MLLCVKDVLISIATAIFKHCKLLRDCQVVSQRYYKTYQFHSNNSEQWAFFRKKSLTFPTDQVKMYKIIVNPFGTPLMQRGRVNFSPSTKLGKTANKPDADFFGEASPGNTMGLCLPNFTQYYPVGEHSLPSLVSHYSWGSIIHSSWIRVQCACKFLL